MIDLFQDEEFKKLSGDEQKKIATNYFNAELADEEFNSLPEEEKSKVLSNFYSSEVGITPVDNTIKVESQPEVKIEPTKQELIEKEHNEKINLLDTKINDLLKTTNIDDETKQTFIDGANLQKTKLEKQKQDELDKLKPKTNEEIDSNSFINSLTSFGKNYAEGISKSNEIDKKQDITDIDTILYMKGAERPVLGLARAIVKNTDKLGLTEDLTNSVLQHIQNNEKEINAIMKANNIDANSLNAAQVGQLVAENIPIMKLGGLYKMSAGAGATASLGEYGKGTTGEESLVEGAKTAGLTLVSGKVLDSLGYVAGRLISGKKDTPEAVLEFIKKNDDTYNNDDAIDEALDKYYKIYEPSNDLVADKVRAVLHSSQLLGSEMKAGAIMFDESTMTPLRQATTDINKMLRTTAKESGNPIDDLATNIDKAVKSPQFTNGMNIIEKNFNADVPMDITKFKGFKDELDAIATLEPDNALIKSLSSSIGDKLAKAKEAGVNPTFTVTELIDFEQSLGRAKYGSQLLGAKGYKVGEADKYVTGLVEDALSKQPEGLELYKQMKQVYSETSPFFKTAKADVENKMALIVKDIQDKNITQEVGLDKLISLQEKGLAKFDEISKVVPAETLEAFENKLADSMLTKTKDYSKLAEMFSAADFKTANAKQIKEQVNKLNDLFKSEKVEGKLRNLLNENTGNVVALTADLVQKAKYAIAGNIWKRILSVVSPEAREAKDIGEILKGTGDIIKDEQKLKGISKVTDNELRKVVSDITAKRADTVTKAKGATQYEKSREVAREENRIKMEEAKKKKLEESKSSKELEAKKKAARLGF